MSNSTESTVTFEGTSTAADPLTALRQALAHAAKDMAAHAVPPTGLIDMSWTARRPAAIHPATTDTDLSYREIFGGSRPSIQVRWGDHDGVRVTIRARKPTVAASPGKAWGGFTLAELAREYNPRALVPNMATVFDVWRQDGTAFRNQHLTAELPFGPTASETVDIYLPHVSRDGGALPLWIFIHGGYWQATDKANHAHFAAGMLGAGYAVAMPNYTLAPAVTVHAIVRQMQQMLVFLAREASALGCDPNQIHVSGHSAGGQLAAMLAALPEGRLIKSALPLSGVFDLTPLSLLPMGRIVGLKSAADVALLSPQGLTPLPHVRLGVAVGGGESAEFRRQTADYAKALNIPSLIVPGKHHFDLLDGLNSGALLEFAKSIAAG
jgi:arylformamidase